MGDSLLSTKAVGEEPTTFKTKTLDVLLDRQRSSDMGGRKLGEGPSGVALPSGNSLFSNNGQSAPDAVDSQVRYQLPYDTFLSNLSPQTGIPYMYR